MNLLLVNFLEDSFLKQVSQEISKFDNLNLFFTLSSSSQKENVDVECIDLSGVVNPRDIRLENITNSVFTSKNGYEEIANNYQKDFLSILPRVTLEIIDVNSANFYYRFLLNFFRTLLLSKQITLVIFDSTPHMPIDFAIFVAARQLDIKCLYPSRTHLGAQIRFVSELEDSLPVIFPQNTFKSDTHIESVVSPWLQESVKHNQRFGLSYQKSLNRRWGRVFLESSRLRLFRFFRLLSLLKSNYWKNHYFRRNRLQMIWVFLKIACQKKRFRNLRKRISISSFDEISEFVFFPLHYQPERSTLPEARYFGDQISALRMIRGLIGEDIPILVKEHPKQILLDIFNPKSLSYRSTLYYKLLLSDPKIYLLKDGVNSSDLISKSLFVASNTGSVIWEAVKQGKFAVSCEKNWLSDFRYSPYIFSEELNNNTIFNYAGTSREVIQSAFDDYAEKIKPTLVPSCTNESSFSYYPHNTQKILIDNYVKAIRYVVLSLK